MGLIDLKTDLKSLRYGKDTLGGGNSGQPYIQTPIPDSFNNLGANEDFILRGGISAVKDSITDIKRLGKMFTDLKSPNGLIFIAKQQLLSRTAVRTQTSGDLNEGIYTPLNTLAQAGLIAFGSHLNKQGRNPFDETGAYANNDALYNTKVKSTQPLAENRLVLLYSGSFVENKSYDLNGLKLNDGQNVMVYTGGPGSQLGSGNTSIKFADQRTGLNNQLAKLSGANKNYFYGKDQQRSVNENNVQIGGLQVKVGNGDKSWIKGGIYFDGGAKNIYNLSTLFPAYANGLSSNSVNTPQSSSLDKVPDGKLTWTPNQELANGRIWYNLVASSSIKSKNTSSVSQAYEQSNNEQLGIPSTPSSKVYSGSVGVNSKLFNLNAEGAQTWTPNQQEELVELRKKANINDGNTVSKAIALTSSISPTQYSSSITLDASGSLSRSNPLSGNSSLVNANSTYVFNQKDIIEVPLNPGKLSGSPKILDFRRSLRIRANLNPQSISAESSTTSSQLSTSLPYSGPDAGNIEKRVNIGDPGDRANKNYGNYAKGVIDVSTNKSYYGNFGKSPAGLDAINSLPIYRSEAVSNSDVVNDLVKFRIAVIDNNNPNFKTFMHFRAFLGPISDSYNASWNNFQYLGRGEQFYTYGGFTRTLSLSWTVAAQSKQELIPMYKKLNYLASTLAPDYSPDGYMRGNLVQLTIGGYLYEQPGFITGLTYEMSDDSPWEIGIGTEETPNDPSVKELTQIIRVSGFNFTPIHNFVPRKQTLGSDTITGFPTVEGPQRFIALSNGTNTNYYNS